MTTHDLVEILLRRLDRQDEVLAAQNDALESLDRKLTAHITGEDAMRGDLEDIADMWRRSRVVAWFLTKLASFVAVGAGAWAWAKDHLK